MELGKQIKKYRQVTHLSQEELADRIYVSRQTISNWENDKNYPDVNSLILLSEVFQISLDTLIKGDIKSMKEIINKEAAIELDRYSGVYAILLITVVVSAIPLAKWLGLWAIIPWGILVAITMYYAIKIEKIKKENNVQTYKEIIAFAEGKRLDEIQKQREFGKRPYQKFLLLMGSGIITILICMLMAFLLK